MAADMRPPTGDRLGLGWRFYAAFAAIMVNNLAAALDATTLSVALPVIPTISALI